MPQQRIKGQETLITVQQDGVPKLRVDTISDTECIFELDILQEGYIGETSDRFDSIFKGMTVRVSGHMTNRQVIDIADAIAQRAQRRAGGAVRFDLTTTLVFPNGDIVSILVPDVHFQSVPITTGSREDYVGFSWEGKASEYELI